MRDIFIHIASIFKSTLSWLTICRKLQTCFKLLVGLLFASIMLSSCNTRKFLKADEALLQKNSISFESDDKIKKKRSLEYELKTLYKQSPNAKALKLTRFRLWCWYKTNDLERPNKFQRWVKKRVAEPPALFQEEIAEATAKSMQNYLQNKGFFNAAVTYEKTLNKKRKEASVKYLINQNTLYTIDSVFFQSTDPKIQRILNDSEEDSFLKIGEQVSNDLYGKEVSRITTTLRNLGFAYFNRNYIDNLKGDSTSTAVKIYLDVLNPKNETEHKIYRIGKITVVPNFRPSEKLQPKQDTIVNGIHYKLDEKGFVVSPNSINRDIFLKEGDLYREDNFVKTNRQLGRLDVYKYISIVDSPNSLEDDMIDFEIRLTPRDRMAIGGDIELNNSNYTVQNDNNSLIGTALSLNYQNRNFRRNASTLELKASSGIEWNLATPDDLIYSLDILAQADWYIPKFVQFPKLTTALTKIGIIKQRFYNDLKDKGETKVSASYNRLLLFNFYNYHSLNLSLGYDLQRNSSNRYTWNQTGVNYLLPRFRPEFEKIRDANPFIQRSFTEQLFTGFLFRDLKYTYTGKSNIFGRSWKFIGDFELSGGEVFLTNWIANGFDKKNEFLLFNEVQFSQYARLNLDLRRYIGLGKNGTFAYKVAIGIARPYGFSEDVPYVKQFYGGGPYGNRAWRIRELGPGGFEEPPPSDDVIQVFYQTGDLKIDFNIEYRFNIFWGMKGALFLDAANVWTLEKDTARLGSQFLWKADPLIPATAPFYEQFGVGVGAGIRYDFSYFVLGLDIGIKARNPFPDEEGRNWLFHRWDKLQLKDVNPNLLIGFPF